MKNRYSLRWAVFLIAGVINAGCAVPTLSGTATIVPAPTQTATLRPTPVPTFTGAQVVDTLELLVRTNGGCDLPCFWGGAIVPGQTTRQEAMDFLDPPNLPDANRPTPQSISFRVPLLTEQGEYDLAAVTEDGLYDYGAWFEIHINNQELVSFIRMGAYIFEDKLSVRMLETVNDRYSWAHVLSLNGPPTHVFVLRTDWESYYGREDIYAFMLVYDSLGMAVQYQGLMAGSDVGASPARYCPRFEEVMRLGFVLTNPDGDPLSEIVTVMDENYPAWLPLEETTGIDVETFYESFRVADADACLQHTPLP